MMSTRTFERPTRTEQAIHPERAIPAKRTISTSLRNALRNAAAIGRFALIWLGGYLGVAAILLLAWAFSS